MISPTNTTTHFRRAAFERELDAARAARFRVTVNLRSRLRQRDQRLQQEAVDAFCEGR